jgi:flagellum-specific peptidoglycan hydrolase FlgJ
MAYSTEQTNFINALAPYIQAECIKRGYRFASPILAQASTESFKGQSLSKLAKTYNNYFGLKCGSSWKGESVNMKTGEEYTKGTITMINDNFRVYANMEQGAKGYFDFINTKRYANLKTATSPEQYLQFIRADGYATSYTYVQTCLSRIAGLNLTRFDNFSSTMPTGNPYPEPDNNIRLNSRGNDVRWLQWILNDKGHYGLIIDGIAGAKTIAALTDYQVHHDLVPDGICGPLTRASLKLS